MPRVAAAAKPQAPASVERAQKTPVRKVRPVRSTRRDLDTTDHKIGQDSKRAMKSRGPAKEALDESTVVAVDRVVSKEKLEALAFMEEEVTIIVHQSTNPIDEPYPEVWNDGVHQMFQRGQPQKVKRKFVEVLARAKKTAFGNEKYKDGNGDDAYRYPSHTALKYPFAVQHDPSGDKGAAWLRNVLAEA